MKSKLRIDRIILFIFMVLVISIISSFFIGKLIKSDVINEIIVNKNNMFIASAESTVSLFNMEFQEEKKINRGLEIIVHDKEIINNDKSYYLINYEEKDYYILKDNIVSEKKRNY